MLIIRARLIGINALSLALGVIANFSILLAVRDGNVLLAKYNLQLLLTTIISGGLASFILIGLIIAASLGLRLYSPPHNAFTEAFYYAILSAVLYFITSMFVIYSAYMLWHKRRSKEEASKLQFAKDYRSLMLLTIVFMAYILLCATVFSHVEGWRYLDAVYWADVTILTVGFGDFKPSTVLRRSLLLPYAACGLSILFLIVYCLPEVVFDRGKSMWEVYLRDQERIRRVQQREEGKRGRNTAPDGHFWRQKATEDNDAPQDSPSNHEATVALKTLSKQVKKNEERKARRKDFEQMQKIPTIFCKKAVILFGLRLGILLLSAVAGWCGIVLCL